MEKKYIPLEREQSVEEKETGGDVSFQAIKREYLLGDAKPNIKTSEELSKRLKRLLSKPLRKLTSTIQDNYKRKSAEPQTAFGYCVATGVAVCSVNPAFA